MDKRAAFGLLDDPGVLCTNMSLGALEGAVLLADGGGVVSSSDNKSNRSPKSGISSQDSASVALPAKGTMAVETTGVFSCSIRSLSNTDSMACHCAAVALDSSIVYEICMMKAMPTMNTTCVL